MKSGALRGITLAVVLTALAALSLASCGGSDHPMATQFKSTILVSDGAVAAPHTDANLKNAWGVAFNPKGFVWVANNGHADGHALRRQRRRAVAGGQHSGDGIRPRQSDRHRLQRQHNGFHARSQGGKSGAAAFIFAGEGGSITAWAPAST